MEDAMIDDNNRFNLNRMEQDIDESIALAIKSVVGDPIDQVTWNKVSVDVYDNLCHLISMKDCLSFSVVCNDLNNPPEVVDANGIICDVFVLITKQLVLGRRGRLDSEYRFESLPNEIVKEWFAKKV